MFVCVSVWVDGCVGVFAFMYLIVSVCVCVCLFVCLYSVGCIFMFVLVHRHIQFCVYLWIYVIKFLCSVCMCGIHISTFNLVCAVVFGDLCVQFSVPYKTNTIQYNFIAKCQGHCTRNVLWHQVHSLTHSCQSLCNCKLGYNSNNKNCGKQSLIRK